jgi:hypothetical protein
VSVAGLVDDAVEGWLTPAQAARLARAAAQVAPGGQIVEIGSFRGRSTIVLARAAAEGVTVTAIDPHLGGDRGPQQLADAPALGEADHVAFHANLQRAGVGDRVRHVRRRSASALGEVTGPVALLYVDGAHRIRPARADLRRWGARVSPGGVLLVHDSFSSVGVTVALLGCVIGRDGWRYAGRDGSLAEYRRAGALSRAEAGAEWAAGLAQLPWFARNLAVKLALVAGLRPLARALGHREGPWPY